MNTIGVNMELCESWISINDRWRFINYYTVIFRLIMHVMNVILSTVYVYGLVQDGSNSIANTLEKLPSCIKSSTCLCVVCKSFCWVITCQIYQAQYCLIVGDIEADII